MGPSSRRANGLLWRVLVPSCKSGPMKLRSAVLVPLFATSSALAACGAAQTESAPAGAPPAGANGGTLAVAGDAGPTTTTTLTLGDSGDLQGTRLTSQTGPSLD